MVSGLYGCAGEYQWYARIMALRGWYKNGVTPAHYKSTSSTRRTARQFSHGRTPIRDYRVLGVRGAVPRQ